MRIIFTGYAINSASVCFLLTLALMMFDEYSEMFDRVVNLIADYMYIAFGPVLFVFCMFGLASIPELSHECLPTRIGDRLNLMDVCIYSFVRLSRSRFSSFTHFSSRID